MLKIRDGGSVARKACYLALAITTDGRREVLGMWFQATEGAKFWMQVLTDLRQQGVQDILICCVDGLKGFPEAIEAVFPQTVVQTCIVHLIRDSLKYVPRRAYDQVAEDLKLIYTASDVDSAQQALEAFEHKWAAQLPPVVKAWRENWEYVIPFMALPPDVRRVIYTTNPIEALNRQLRKAIKTKGPFPSQEAAQETDLSIPDERHLQVDPSRRLDESPPGIQDPLRRPPTPTDAYTVRRTPSRRWSHTGVWVATRFDRWALR